MWPMGLLAIILIYLDGNWIVALTELATKAQILPKTPEVLLYLSFSVGEARATAFCGS